jgi:tetratricopeptide (TPR) repeat protein
MLVEVLLYLNSVVANYELEERYFSTDMYITSSAQQESAEKKSETTDTIEEIIIEGDPISESLKGALKDAFEAFNSGDFAKAEQKFSILANKEYRTAREQRFTQENASRVLPLPQGRTASFSVDKYESDIETPRSAPRATANSINHYVSVAKLEKVSSTLFYLKGVSQIQQGKNKKAIKAFRKALKLSPTNIDARIELTLTLLKQGKLDAGGKHIDKLDHYADEPCTTEKCLFHEDARNRYAQIKLAYTNLANSSNTSK